MLKYLFFLYILFFTTLFAKATPKYWYSYFIKGYHIGYASVKYETKGKGFYKKQLKYRISPAGIQQENISAVLAVDCSLQSAFLSSRNQQKNSNFTAISVTNGQIIIQDKGSVVSFNSTKFYLDSSDFLRSLVLRGHLKYARMYRGLILASSHRQLSVIKARYTGQDNFAINLKTQKCHVFKVTTGELKNFWGTACVDNFGNLVSYELGGFEVVQVPSSYALQLKKSYPLLKMPYIFHNEKLQKLYLKLAKVSPLIRSGLYQRVKKNLVLLLSPNSQKQTKPMAINLARYLRPSWNIPSQSPLILNYAKKAAYSTHTPAKIVKNIAEWIKIHLSKKQSPTGTKLSRFLGRPKFPGAITTVSFCRAMKIPARLVAGLYYRPGRFRYETWPEVFLGKWIPVMDGKIGGGACFLSIFPGKSWSEVSEIPNISPIIYGFVKNNRKIPLKKCLVIQGNKVEDHLLGISFLRPADWVLLPKKTQSDMIALRSLKGKGPAILLKVFPMPKPLQEILRSVAGKIGHNSDIKILWTQPRIFSGGGQAMEIALQSQTKGMIYRCFVAESHAKGIFALLIVPTKELMLVESGFQKLISSLKWESDR